MIHPEFEQRITSKIASAVLRTLRADSALSSYLKEVVGIETEAIYLEGAFSLPSIGVAINEQEMDPGSTQCHDLQTVIQIVLAQEIKKTRVEDGWLRARIVDHIRTIFLQLDGGAGVLRDDEGTRITDALTRFRRVGSSLHNEGFNENRTLIEVEFQSRVSKLMEFET